MHFFFAYYPYICITLLLGGLAFRYVTDPGDGNASPASNNVMQMYG